MMEVPTQDQVAGCLLGQSLADALASFVRGATTEYAGSYVDHVLSKWIDHESLNDCPDQLFISEGSQLSWEIVRLFRDERQFLPQAFAQCIKEMFDRRLVRARYIETHLAVKQLRSGTAWHDAGVDSSGCGSIQRSPAIGVLFWDRQADRQIAAEQQSMITHDNRIVDAASVMVSELVASLLRRESGPESELFPIAVPQDDPGFGPLLTNLPDLLNSSPDDALALICPKDGIEDLIGQGLPWALYCAANSKWDFVKALKCVLRCGGESIASAALVGAMCGASRGIEGLPGHLFDRLCDTGGSGGVTTWCEDCHHIV
jgi:ADP-ribosylglycohydrolase